MVPNPRLGRSRLHNVRPPRKAAGQGTLPCGLAFPTGHTPAAHVGLLEIQEGSWIGSVYSRKPRRMSRVYNREAVLDVCLVTPYHPID